VGVIAMVSDRRPKMMKETRSEKRQRMKILRRKTMYPGISSRMKKPLKLRRLRPTLLERNKL